MPARDPASRRDETERRLAVGGNPLRRVDEALERGTEEGPLRVRCECGHLGCTAFVEVGVAASESVRSGFERVLLVPGHEEGPDAVVEDHGSSLVVIEVGAGSVVARQDGPRPDQAPEADPR